MLIKIISRLAILKKDSDAGGGGKNLGKYADIIIERSLKEQKVAPSPISSTSVTDFVFVFCRVY